MVFTAFSTSSSGALLLAATVVALVAVAVLLEFCRREGWSSPWMAVGAAAGPPLVLTPQNADAYVINLASNPERLRSFVRQFDASDLRGMPLQRFDAIDGRALPQLEQRVSGKALQELRATERTGVRTKHYQLTRGAVGCYLSHLGVYQAIARGSKPYGIVFEDDVVIPRDAFQKLHVLLASVPRDWDLVLMGCFCIACTRVAPTFQQVQRFFFLHAYVITRAAAQRIVAALATRPIERQIDWELSRLTQAGAEEGGPLRVYCTGKEIVRQSREFRTTIQVPIQRQAGVNPYADG